MRNSRDTAADWHTGCIDPFPILVETNHLERLQWSIARSASYRTSLSFLSTLTFDHTMFDEGFLTRWSLAHVFVAVLGSGTEHLVRFTLGHFHDIKVRPGSESHACYADKVRFEAHAHFSHVKEWLCHVVQDRDDTRISLTWKLRLHSAYGDDAAGFVNKLDFDSLVERTVICFSIGADIENNCCRHDRTIERDLQPVIVVREPVLFLAGTPCMGLVRRGLANLCQENVISNVNVYIMRTIWSAQNTNDHQMTWLRIASERGFQGLSEIPLKSLKIFFTWLIYIRKSLWQSTCIFLSCPHFHIYKWLF